MSGSPTFTDGDDTLDGGTDNDTLYGGNGNDILNGYGGNDILSGDAGNDTINAGAGDDLIIGGTGDDYLQGGNSDGIETGSDTYQFSRGDGWDTIDEYDWTGTSVDTVQFMDVASTDYMNFNRVGQDLVIGYGMSDQLVVRNYFNGSDHLIEQFQFSDGVTWTEADIKARTLTYGTNGDDFIYGYDGGNNVIFGLGGDDELHGGALFDYIEGGDGRDFIFGNAESDNLRGGDGDDFIDGGAGNDMIEGGNGDDRLLGGESGSDTYSFTWGQGADTIVDFDASGYDRDTVYFNFYTHGINSINRIRDDLVLGYGYGDEVVVHNYFMGDAWEIEEFRFVDWYWAEADIKNRTMTEGTADHDNIVGYDGGSNRMYGLDGNDSLSGGDSSDTVDGGNGDDFLIGQSGDDFIQGGAGSDFLIGGAGNDYYVFSQGDGVDVIDDYDPTYGYDTVLFLEIPSTASTALERHGNNLVIKYGVDDQVTVMNYFDFGMETEIERIDFAYDGVSWDRNEIMSRVITMGDANNNYIFGDDDGPNQIYGLEGDDQLIGGAQADTIDGGAGMDNLSGSWGADSLHGGQGDDWLDGGDGDDTLRGGADTDLQFGGNGNDTYVFAQGDGVDIVQENFEGDGYDKIVFIDVASTGLNALERQGNSLVIKYGLGDQVTVMNLFSSDSPSFAIEQFQFSDGVIWNMDDIKARVITVGDDNGNSITGFEDSSSRIHGLGGDDYLTGGALADMIDGGSGSDIISGGEGDDTLIGGTEDDMFHGGAGNDTYVFAQGDGVDNIIDHEAGPSLDKIVFTDVASTDLRGLERQFNNLIIKYGTSDQVTALNFFETGVPGFEIEQIQFSDGVVWSRDDVKSRVITLGNEGNNEIYGYDDGPNQIYGLAGDDQLYGGAQGDTLDGGAGGDGLIGNAGADYLSGGDNDDALHGGDDDDTLNGGAGSDLLSGGAGNDTYVFAQGDGFDSIVESDAGTSFDKIVFVDVASTGLPAFERQGNHLVIKYGVDDQVIVIAHFDRNYPRYEVEQIQFSDGVIWNTNDIRAHVITVGNEFNDYIFGEDDSPHQIHGLAGDDQLFGGSQDDTLDGGVGRDMLDGRGGADYLNGGEDDDRLDGGDDNDTLVGGTGSEHLFGGSGNDTYVFAQGDGDDIVQEYFTEDNADKIVFSDVTSTGLRALERQNDNLVIKYGVDDEITVMEYFNSGSPNYEVEQIHFSDGVIWNRDDIRANVITLGDANNNYISGYDDGPNQIYGLAGDDQLSGGAQGDTIDGGTGSDYLYGNGGSDYLSGGDDGDILGGGDGDDTLDAGAGSDALFGNAGNDVLAGGAGNDTYAFNLGDGTDMVFDVATATEDNVIAFGQGISRADLSFELSNGVLTLHYSANDAIVLSGFDLFGANGSVVAATVMFANEAPVSMAELINSAPVVLTPIASQAATEDAAFSFQIPANAFTDPDQGDVLSLSVTLANGDVLPPWLSFDSVTGLLSGTPDNGNVGALTVKVTATDLLGQSVAQTFSLRVNNVNDAPTVSNALVTQAATEDQLFSFTIPADTFADVDAGDSLTYSATLTNGDPLPTWLSFNATTGTLSGTPDNSAVGTVNVRITAADTSNVAVSSTFSVVVANTNDVPVVLTGIVSQAATEDAAFSFQIPANAFTDPDQGDVLSLSVTLGNGDVLPPWLSFDPVTGLLSGTPDNGNVGTLTVKVTATDLLGQSVAQTFSLLVNNVNDAPTVSNALVTQAATEDQLFSFTIPANTFADVDAGDSLTYSATLANGNPLPSWLSFNASTGTLSGTPTNSVVGTINVKITASDTSDVAASSTFSIVVANTNDAPVVINPVADQSATDGTAFSFTLPGNAFSDVDAGDTLIYTAKLDNGSALPSWLTFNSATRTFSGTPGESNIGSLNLQVTATDAGGLQVSDFFVLAVAAAAPMSLTGTSGANTLTGASGNDTLNGGAGIDTMIGKGGNDTYIVDNTSDVVTEALNGGTDLVQSSASYTLRANVENLTLTGTAVTGTGNDLGNVLTGNASNNTLNGLAGNDTLDGGAGGDKMFGGTGNDTYFIDNTKDAITENLNEGIDTVKSAITYTMAPNIEALYLTDSNAINGTGNGLANLIIGNAGNNTLKGLLGTDILQGAAGVDTLNDVDGNNLLDGGAGADILIGGIGRDFFAGGIGNDTITTGTGADVIAFNRGDGIDLVNASTGGGDTLSLGNGIKYADLLFKKNANDLILVTGTNEQITFKDWYLSTNNRSVSNLQVVIEGSTDYNAGSASQINNNKVEQFNFLGLVSQFDQARAATPTLTSWALSSSLLQFHLGGSDTQAIGGDLAYQYAMNGNLSNISMTPAQAILASGQFGSANQTLQSASVLADTTPRLI